MSDLSVLDDVRAICARLPAMPDDASYVQVLLIRELQAGGFRVLHEYTVTMPNGRAGRIDVVAVHPGGRWIAIEIDARKPRKRSVIKLNLGKWLRISCLRGVEGGMHAYPGLDAVIALPVRLASHEEKSSKAPVRAVGRKARGYDE